MTTPIGKTNDLHLYSDKDSSKLALHHTLGSGKNQASPGNHKHTGADGSLFLPKIVTSYEIISFTSLTSKTVDVVFEEEFEGTPNVITNIYSTSGTVSRWFSTATDTTSTGFTLWVRTAGTAQTWSDVIVDWTAIYAG